MLRLVFNVNKNRVLDNPVKKRLFWKKQRGHFDQYR